jgi:hypothetical protein
MDFNIENLKTTAFIRFFGATLNPLVAIVSPTVVEMSETRTVLKIPLNYVTRNHLRTMYFGALNIGAELSIAILAFKLTRESKHRIDFLFKDFKAQYLKRAEGDVHFICEQNAEVRAQIEEAEGSDERITRQYRAYAIVPSKDPNEVIAEFELSLSVRRRVKK